MFHCLYEFSWGKFWHSIIGYPFNSIQVMLNIRSVDGVLPPNEGTSDSNYIGGYVSMCYFTNRVQLYVNTFCKHLQKKYLHTPPELLISFIGLRSHKWNFTIDGLLLARRDAKLKRLEGIGTPMITNYLLKNVFQDYLNIVTRIIIFQI